MLTERNEGNEGGRSDCQLKSSFPSFPFVGICLLLSCGYSASLLYVNKRLSLKLIAKRSEKRAIIPGDFGKKVKKVGAGDWGLGARE